MLFSLHPHLKVCFLQEIKLSKLEDGWGKELHLYSSNAADEGHVSLSALAEMF